MSNYTPKPHSNNPGLYISPILAGTLPAFFEFGCEASGECRGAKAVYFTEITVRSPQNTADGQNPA